MDFLAQLDSKYRSELQNFKSPLEIQAYLDGIPYISEELDRSPLRVMQDQQCHCLDGAILAALALRLLGYPALIMDLVPEPGNDDDHVLALFQVKGQYGALAKSNFSGLRYREPVYRSLRELAMSYFEDFFNVEGQKTLRGYTRPINLAAFDRYNWVTTESGVKRISKRLYTLQSLVLVKPENIALLSRVDERSYRAGMLGVNWDGLYKL